MKKNKKKTPVPVQPDPRLAADPPSAVSAEFVPTADPGSPVVGAPDAEDVFDFIPELRGNKFS